LSQTSVDALDKFLSTLHQQTHAGAALKELMSIVELIPPIELRTDRQFQFMGQDDDGPFGFRLSEDDRVAK
jgi:hypothetical protein